MHPNHRGESPFVVARPLIKYNRKLRSLKSRRDGRASTQISTRGTKLQGAATRTLAVGYNNNNIGKLRCAYRWIIMQPRTIPILYVVYIYYEDSSARKVAYNATRDLYSARARARFEVGEPVLVFFSYYFNKMQLTAIDINKYSFFFHARTRKQDHFSHRIVNLCRMRDARSGVMYVSSRLLCSFRMKRNVSALESY